MEIPKILIDFVKDGQVVLFLGSGATFGAIHPDGKKPPLGQELSDLISRKFLGDDYLGLSLQQVSELAISESDLFTFQKYIYDLFINYGPSDFHKLLPKFVWKAIATTNYDLIVERSYDSDAERLQEPVVFIKNSDRVEEKLKQINSLCYYKLHGCITVTNDPVCPLILTPEQYITARSGRSRLFERIESLAHEYPFLFIGHSLTDTDIREILLEISKIRSAKPRSYIVTPNMKPAEKRLWESKKYHCIQASFESFLKALDAEIKTDFRVLSVARKADEDHPIFDYLCPKDDRLISSSLKTFLYRDVECVHNKINSDETDPKAFYKGYFFDWGPILNNLDVKRSINDKILSEVFLVEEEERSEIVDFYLVKGHAGSGKTVIANRISYEAATIFDKICLKLNQSGSPEYEPLVELYSICKKRIFLIVDPISNHIDVISEFVRKAKKDRLPLTIVGFERNSTWNSECESLYGYLTDSFQVRYLNENEVDRLIDLLSQHDSLGHLEGLSRDEQKHLLGKRAGRQILVALHEATLGKPFSDIVLDEYNSISSLEAKSLYLSVCIMHRIGVPVRAGLISRVHSISFKDFEKRLFGPLEFIVFAKYNSIIGDFQYQTRHQQVADMVFERVLCGYQERYDEYIRLLDALDVSFNSDREVFSHIINAKKLIRTFNDPHMIRQIYELSKTRDSGNPFIFQQEAIFEMNSPGGSLDTAEKLLQAAHRIDDKNRIISHSLAELSLKKAERSSNMIEKQKHLSQARSLALTLSKSSYEGDRPTHTILKVELEEFGDILDTADSAIIERKVKAIQKLIERAKQEYPDSSFILDSEAMFSEMLMRHPLALESLKKAFNINKRSSYIALRLSNIYERQGNTSDSLNSLKECLERNPSDKSINNRIAYLMGKYSLGTFEEIKYHLRRSFTMGDDNYISQFWYARALYIGGEIGNAWEFFNILRNLHIDNRVKKELRGILKDDEKIERFSGTVTKIENSYCFILRDGIQDSIFSHITSNDRKEWSKISVSRRVVFSLAFNFRGPQAIKILLESESLDNTNHKTS